MRQTGVVGSISQGPQGYLVSQIPTNASQTYSSQMGAIPQRNTHFVDPTASNYR